MAGKPEERARGQADGVEPGYFRSGARQAGLTVPGATVHFGGQNFARYSNKRYDTIYEQIRVLPDGPEREQLFREAKRILAVDAPYRFHVHRILTDLAWPWLIGYRRQLYSQTFWQYVDIDVAQQA